MSHSRASSTAATVLDGRDDAKDDATIVMAPEAAGTGGADAPMPCTTEGAVEGTAQVPPHGLADQTNFLPARQVIMVFLGLSVGLSCAFLDQTIVATALPRISSDLHSGQLSSWVATAYLLTSLALTPLYGRWSDVFGRKVVLMSSLAVFWLFSLACALSKTMIQLIIFRAFQGIGGGAIITMVLIIVSDIVSLKDRGKFQGIQEGVIALSNGTGPILGGIFSQYTTWRWAFWINLPMGGAAIAIAFWLLPLKPVEGDIRSKFLKIDYLGSALTIISSILILLGLTWGGVTYPWVSAQVLVPLILGITVLAVFLLWESKWAKLPIIPVHIFKHSTVSGVYIATLMNGMTFFAILYYVPQFLQLVRASSPITSSVLMLPFLAPIAFVVFGIGQITSRTGIYKPFIVTGFALWTIAQGLLSTIDGSSSTGKIAGILLMAGLSSGFTFQTSLIAAQAAVPRHEMAVVTGVRNFVRLFGSTLTLAICASIVNNSLRASLGPLNLSPSQVSTILNDPTSINNPNVAGFALSAEDKVKIVEGYTRGFKGVFYLTVACTATAFLASVLLIRQHGLDREDDEVLKKAGKERLRERKMRKSGKVLEVDVEADEKGKEELEEGGK
ncbi:hypothetical protein JAAARDRAFT_34295 [Jaapia argillacea MUCL 33604]|uniref:Major facilitator superfamily (MFS) profile domain-containing protein n=1 Tax=Jaapia argillacea MUCL 33604 TaxID=933084 RepID=A0A067PX91_9AGAM|nr:hypothetical protein JAAARDRAFT_34295 [Jaapia argillacea MUCL 33604]